MNPFLSVIIPVYNVENYLERCVSSVVNQDFESIEIILVDDGSPDRCPQICDRLAQQYDNVHVIHKVNGGLSSARNVGIDVARGKYIVFLDSDDQWAPNCLKPLIDELFSSKVDMLMFNSYSLYPDGVLTKRFSPSLGGGSYHIYETLDLYRKLIESGDLKEQAGTYFISTSFLRSNNLCFKEGILCEDTEWMFRILRVIKKIAVSDKFLMIYTEQRPGSITNTISIKRIVDLLGIIQSSLDYFSIYPKDDVRYYEIAQCSYLWSIVLGYYPLLPYEDSRELRPIIIKLHKQLALSTHPKSNLVGKIYSLFGFNITSYILSFYLKLHSKNLVNKKITINE